MSKVNRLSARDLIEPTEKEWQELLNTDLGTALEIRINPIVEAFRKAPGNTLAGYQIPSTSPIHERQRTGRGLRIISAAIQRAGFVDIRIYRADDYSKQAPERARKWRLGKLPSEEGIERELSILSEIEPEVLKIISQGGVLTTFTLSYTDKDGKPKTIERQITHHPSS